VTRGAAVASADGAIAEAAAVALEAGGGAVDALVAGFAMAAALDGAVLLAPTVALLAGIGVGGRAFDGRAVQPGRGASRPRGYVDGAAVPDGALVAAPRTVAMLAVLHAYRGRARLASLVAPAAARAARDGARARADVLRHFGDAGALLMHRPGVQRALLAVGGRVAGGALTAEDLTDARPGEAEATATGIDGATIYTAPWVAEGELTRAEGIVAADGHGLVAALAYAPSRDGMPIPDLELSVGRLAKPVQRGVPRTAPGTAIPVAAPIAVIARAGGFHAAIAAAGRSALVADDLTGAALGLSAEGLSRTALASLAAIAALWDGDAARAYSVTP